MRLFEDGPTTTNFQQLVDRGIELPAPDDLAIADVTTKLWEVINGLAQLRVYLDCTDHLTDAELYRGCGTTRSGAMFPRSMKSASTRTSTCAQSATTPRRRCF